jgi:sulfate permease, SulP family
MAFHFRRLFPFLEWPRITRETLRADLVAGVTVALVAVPQSLAYAQLAGVPPQYGLYASVIPAILGTLFGSSLLLSTGPVAMTSLLTAASVGVLVPPGTEQFFAYVTLLALLSGLFQLGFGLARAGLLLSLVSHPVLMGFINAAALIIAMSQLPGLLGIPTRESGRLVADTWDVITRMDSLNAWSLGFGLAAFAMFVAFRKFAPRLPGVLITVAILIAVSDFTGFAAHGGRIVGSIPAGPPGVGVPALEWSAITALLPAAFVIALISFMEAMSSCKAIAIKTRARWDENQELIGQGIAKIAAAFCQSMPVSGSFSRSALNLAANARTGLSALVTAACVLGTLLFFTPLLYHLPKSVLAAVIMLAVFSLLDFDAFRRSWRASREDGVAATATFVATLAFAPSIQNGILTGIIVSLATFMYGRMRPKVEAHAVHDEDAANGEGGRSVSAKDAEIGTVRFDASLYFANVSYFEKTVLELGRAHPRLRYIVINANGINHLDASGVEMLRNLKLHLEQSGIMLVLAEVKRHILDVARRTGLVEVLGQENFYPTVEAAIEDVRRRKHATDQPTAPAG